jgi:hypothetical protein
LLVEGFIHSYRVFLGTVNTTTELPQLLKLSTKLEVYLDVYAW